MNKTRVLGCLKYAVMALVVLMLLGGLIFWWVRPIRTERISRIRQWFQNPAAYTDWQVEVGERCY